MWHSQSSEPKGANGNQHLAAIGEGTEYELGLPSELDYDTADKYQASIVENRLGYFCSMRFPLSEALTLAKRRDVDHHAAARHLAAGATHSEVLEFML